MHRHGVPGDPPALVPYLADLTAAALHSWNAHVPDPSLLIRVTPARSADLDHVGRG